MFQLLTKTKTLFRSINVLGENHGDEIYPGVSLAFEFVVANDWLENLARGMKAAFYTKRGQGSDQGSLDIEMVSDTPHLRYPELGALNWSHDYTGVTLVLEHGATGNDIVVRDCKVTSLSLALLEGGSVKCKGSAVSSAPDESARGRITSKIKQEVLCRFLPPKLDGQADISGAVDEQPAGEPGEDVPWPFGDQGANNKPATSKRRRKAPAKDATETFLDAHGSTA
jgi:hypothetical protein